MPDTETEGSEVTEGARARDCQTRTNREEYTICGYNFVRRYIISQIWVVPIAVVPLLIVPVPRKSACLHDCLPALRAFQVVGGSRPQSREQASRKTRCRVWVVFGVWKWG